MDVWGGIMFIINMGLCVALALRLWDLLMERLGLRKTDDRNYKE